MSVAAMLTPLLHDLQNNVLAEVIASTIYNVIATLASDAIRKISTDQRFPALSSALCRCFFHSPSPQQRRHRPSDAAE